MGKVAFAEQMTEEDSGKPTCQPSKGAFMNLWDIVILVIVVLAVALAAGKMIRDKKQGKCSCGGDCGHCACGCGKRK